MPRLFKLFSTMACAALLAAVFTPAVRAAEPLRIGVPTDLSGTYATLGE